jgi:hypothetical protein
MFHGSIEYILDPQMKNVQVGEQYPDPPEACYWSGEPPTTEYKEKKLHGQATKSPLLLTSDTSRPRVSVCDIGEK